MAPHAIRIAGDPVLRSRADAVSDIDGRLVRLCDEMLTTMYDAPGLGLAAPQIGVKKRLFVYDLGDGPHVLVNPEITETDGEWAFDEGCLSIPELSWEIVRPKQVHLVGLDLDGNDVSIEADELLARLFQHEMDHLNGVLLLDLLEPEERGEALRALQERATALGSEPASGLSLP